MSHFAVIVIGDNIEEQLAPYDENTEVEPYWTELYKSATWDSVDSISEWLNGDGHYAEAHEFDNVQLVVNGDEWTDGKDYEPSEKLAALLNDWGNGRYRFHDGRWQEESTYNPKSKWDWYSIGGRWQGYFRTKKPVSETDQANLGTPGAFGGDPHLDVEWEADSILKGDIDFKGMQASAILEAEERYDKYEADGDAMLFWPKKHRERSEYLADFQTPWIPYAIVKDGEWYEKGTMGWWAVSSNEDPNWPKEAQKMIDEIPDDVLVTMVDCHI